MKNIAPIFFLLLMIGITNGQTTLQNKLNTTKLDSNKTDNWFAADKGQHFVGSLIGTILLTNINDRYLGMQKPGRRAVAAGVMLSIGLTKETFDSTKPGNIFSWKDILANIAGILTGIAIMEIK